ncbi:hypothetical protein BGZ63DRAFT_400984 [Mariannaea sp. PMI_226]|nr:hypothetical protein BGZ63DRAFT_400984 [Mariannaea sp. PMI_226]
MPTRDLGAGFNFALSEPKCPSPDQPGFIGLPQTRLGPPIAHVRSRSRPYFPGVIAHAPRVVGRAANALAGGLSLTVGLCQLLSMALLPCQGKVWETQRMGGTKYVKLEFARTTCELDSHAGDQPPISLPACCRRFLTPDSRGSWLFATRLPYAAIADAAPNGSTANICAGASAIPTHQIVRGTSAARAWRVVFLSSRTRPRPCLVHFLRSATGCSESPLSLWGRAATSDATWL